MLDTGDEGELGRRLYFEVRITGTPKGKSSLGKRKAVGDGGRKSTRISKQAQTSGNLQVGGGQEDEDHAMPDAAGEEMRPAAHSTLDQLMDSTAGEATGPTFAHEVIEALMESSREQTVSTHDSVAEENDNIVVAQPNQGGTGADQQGQYRVVSLGKTFPMNRD